MAIWLWILAAWAICLLTLRGRKIRLEHFIWLLFPVDMYGLTVAGVTFKPYMIFCGVLLFRMLLSGRHELSVKSRWSLISGIMILLMIGLSAINSQSIQSLISTAMMAVVWVCTMIYLNDCGDDTPDMVSEVLIAAGVGFGAVFVFGYLCMELNLDIPGIVAYSRSESGFFLSFNNVYEGQFLTAVRLRGFTIDPNAMVGAFLYSISISLFRLVTGKGRIREILSLLLSVLCVILSNSRMALICCILIVVISVIVGYQMADMRCKGRIKSLLLCLLAVLVLITVTGILPGIIRSVLESYKNRSGLNDEYGRFTIWKEAAKVLWEENLFFGIGFGQMQYYTVMSRACHNTWLEFVCAFGLLLGGLTVDHFAVMLLSGLRDSIRHRTDAFAWTMVLGTMGVMISLLSVDNLTANYLWFGSTVVSAISSGCWRKII